MWSYSRADARHDRDGAHTGAGTYAVVNRVPAAAILRVVGLVKKKSLKLVNKCSEEAEEEEKKERIDIYNETGHVYRFLKPTRRHR